MTIDERTRHEMYLGLEEKLGTTVADALMAHLPPVGWADVATKHDLGELERRLDLRFDRVADRFDRVDDRFARVADRFDALEERFARVDDRFAALEERMDLRFAQQDEHIDARIHAEINRLLLFLFPTMLTGLGLAAVIGKVT